MADHLRSVLINALDLCNARIYAMHNTRTALQALATKISATLFMNFKICHQHMHCGLCRLLHFIIQFAVSMMNVT